MSTTTPLPYATPPAFAPGQGQVCPVCNERPISSKTLYGYAVCKKCVNRFANRRQIAYIVDSLVLTIPVVVALLLLERTLVLSDAETFLVTLAFGIAVALVFTLRDGFGGRSPGKRLCGVQVVDAATNQPIGFGQSLKRNWWYLLGQIPIVGRLVALGFTVTAVIQMMRGPRIGDRFARTRVIWLRYADSPVFGGTGVRCLTCGYDLTGNESGRCPECGVPADVVPVAPEAVAALA